MSSTPADSSSPSKSISPKKEPGSAKGVAQKKLSATKPKTSARRRTSAAPTDGEQDGSGEDSEDVYIAEKIIKHREHKRYFSYEYLMRWEGFGPEDDTWEPHESIIDSATVLVDEYWAPLGGYEANRLDRNLGSKHKSLTLSADLDPSNTLNKRLRRRTDSISASALKQELDESEKGESPTPHVRKPRAKSPATRSPRVKSPRVKSERPKKAPPAPTPAAPTRPVQARSPPPIRQKVDGDAWSPPIQLITWENLAKILTLEQDNDELYVYLEWPQEDSQRSRHKAEVIYQKMPQSMLEYYESNVVFKPVDD